MNDSHYSCFSMRNYISYFEKTIESLAQWRQALRLLPIPKDYNRIACTLEGR